MKIRVKKILSPVLLSLGIIGISTVISTSVYAVSYTDSADITGSEEVYKTVQVQKPYQYCYEEPINQRGYSDGSATNEILGGILGGVVGNQFGGGSGKDVATVAGVLLGASLANDSEKEQYRQNNTSNAQTREVCKTRYRYQDVERFSHYLVRYNYKGVDGTYHANRSPKSEKVNVRVDVKIAP